ncbi:FtsX-like permease family protein [Chitinophaga sp. SYP-B3965]|uniref:ABC transporter permease n=1 Tax=Chitinophaga sp. SYP-B3965 TaxID=2663120 RepID=UPI001299A7B9|nr:ABC transporter permease [Chitinophaga sp. SYP-B3965]MRG46246.1 FtsX-like permease family protein [Chitinophaga sp. SYP-B3965]
MIRNYFKLAFRNLWRNKVFTAINISGLAMGIAICLVIILFIKNEWSYDRYNEKAGRIVRVVFKGTVQGQAMKEANVMPPTAQTLLKDYPEVEAATRLRTTGNATFSHGEKSFKEEGLAFADANFFSVFTLPFVKGDPSTALLEPNTIVISEAIAQKYFGQEDPMGKLLEVKSQNAILKVTGVMKAIPVNSHFHFDIFTSMVSLPDQSSDSWMTSGYFTYLLLKPGIAWQQLDAKLPQVVEKYMGPQLHQSMGFTLAEFRKKGNDIGLYLQPLTDIHLRSNLMPMTEMEPPGDIRYVYIFGAVALFMLLIACINFMNLSTAGASKRAREVGIRKVLGSAKTDLIRQFLLESILLTGFAMLLGLVLVYLALPVFNHLTGKDLSLGLTTNPWLIPGLMLFGLFVGVLAGSYPAFMLSSFNPVKVLKGRFTGGRATMGLRSGLVVFQFSISIILIMGTLVVYKQLMYIQNKKLGYEKDQVIVLPETSQLGPNENAFRERLLQDPRVVNISTSGYLPAGPTYNNNFFVYAKEEAAQIKTLRYDVDYNYIPTMSMQVIAGRNFSKTFGTDSSAVILNETAVKALGWDNSNALGQTITKSNKEDKVTYHVIGIVKDFHFKSLHEQISPLVMVLANYSGTMIVKAKTKDISGLLADMYKEWASFKAAAPLNYSFLDERFKATYEAEQKIALILGISAGLTIFVACLGLFGLATFTAEQRTKEIGVRKVLGATVTSIVALLSRDFLKLVLIANVLALPVAWWVMNRWLQDFAYRINISWWVFVVATFSAVLIALVAVGFHSIKAALTNPVKSLRGE